MTVVADVKACRIGAGWLQLARVGEVLVLVQYNSRRLEG